MATPEEKDKKTGTGDAAAQETAGTQVPAASTSTTENAKTIEEMLNDLRRPVEEQKTSAEKMKRYYALTDAMKALGKMGGAAVGGAIGGDVLAGASTPEYKPNRGYIDAIEKAKQANDRLRAIDDTGFNLAVSRKQRDEDRAYQNKVRAEDRAFRLELDRADKEWQKVMADYNAAIRQAELEKNYELKSKYESELAAKQHEYWKTRAEIEHRYGIEEKRIVPGATQAQIDAYNKVPIAFNDGTAMEIDKRYYDGMRRFFINPEQNITEKDVDQYIRDNPKMVHDYLALFGVGTASHSHTTSATDGSQRDSSGSHPFPAHISQVPPEYMNGSSQRNEAPSQPQGDGGYSIENDPFAHRLV